MPLVRSIIAMYRPYAGKGNTRHCPQATPSRARGLGCGGRVARGDLVRVMTPKGVAWFSLATPASAATVSDTAACDRDLAACAAVRCTRQVSSDMTVTGSR